MSTKSQTRVSIVIVVLLCSAALAQAQDASQAPAGTRPLADTPFQLILPTEHLLGDWYGTRGWLEDHGITPTLTFVTDALGNPTGGQRQGFTGFSNLAANLYIVAFGVSWGPVMWVLLGEMFPNQLRGAALAVSGATNWAANFAVTVTFLPLLNAACLAGAYALYATGAVLSLPFVWTAVRETKGKTLEEM